ncbi:MAG: TIM barrel protein [Candidatus Limnocylindrales bacterium]|jgi:hydroxypyruvate isomerase
MTQFAANLSMLYTERPFLDRFEVASAAGFGAVEFWWPNQPLSQGVTLDEIVRRVRDLRLKVVLLNFDAGNMPAGDRGLAGDPVQAGQFRANVPVAIEFAREMGCRKLNALAGNVVPGFELADQLDLLAESVGFAAEEAARAGMTVLLEALNPIDTPLYLLPRTVASLAVIERLGRPNVMVQFDTYHVAKAGDDPVATIATVGSRIGHVQFADFPGRHEPGTGQLPFRQILAALADAGYGGAVGLEFAPLDPAAPDLSCLKWLGA